MHGAVQMSHTTLVMQKVWHNVTRRLWQIPIAGTSFIFTLWGTLVRAFGSVQYATLCQVHLAPKCMKLRHAPRSLHPLRVRTTIVYGTRLLARRSLLPRLAKKRSLEQHANFWGARRATFYSKWLPSVTPPRPAPPGDRDWRDRPDFKTFYMVFD